MTDRHEADSLARLGGLAEHVLDHLPAWVPLPAAFLDALGLLRLGGEIADPGLASVAELRGLAAETQTVTYLSGGQPVTDTYAGVLLRDLLAHAGGGVTDAGVKNDILNHYVVATGSDGYHAVFSLGELEQKFGDEPVMVAYADQSGQLGPGGEDGWLRMVVPGDAAGGRYVSNLVGLKVVRADNHGTGDLVWG